MATKQKPQPADDTPGILEDVFTAEQLSPAMEKLYAEMEIEDSGQSYVLISKILEGGKEGRVWQGPPSDYDLNEAAKVFGSGDYRVKLYGPHESGRIVVRANRVFTMILKPGEDERIEAARAVKTEQAAQAAQPALTPESLAMAIAAAIKAAMPAPVDTLGQFKQFAEAMRSMMPAPAPAPVAQPMDFMTVMGAAKTLLEVSKGVNPTVPVGEDGKPDFASTAMLKAMDMFGNVLANAQKAAPAGAPALPAPSTEGVLPAAVEANAQPAPDEEDEENMLMLKLQLKKANRAAKQGDDPATFAEDVYAVLPEDVISAMATNSEWFSVLTAIVPECSQYAVWYATARNKIVDMAVEDGFLLKTADGALTVAPEESSVAGDGSPATPAPS